MLLPTEFLLFFNLYSITGFPLAGERGGTLYTLRSASTKAPASRSFLVQAHRAKILPKQKDLQLNTLNEEPVPPAMLSLGRQHGHLCCGSRIYLRHIHTENRKPLIPGVRVGFYISTLESRSL